ncbi:MAG TPA: hypothetical protein VIH11_06095 [Gemmatimonadaceae bacterium]
MAETIRLELDTAAFARTLKLAESALNRALAKAITRTAFEVRDAEAAEAGRVFEFAGPSTREFLSGRRAFRIEGARPDRLEASIFPAPRTGEILEPHVRGAVIAGGEPHRFTIEKQLATPVALKRTARGRVRGRRGKRTFVAGRAVLQRIGKGARSTVRVLFALVPRAKLEPRFDFYRVARDTARRHFATKVREEMAKPRSTR